MANESKAELVKRIKSEYHKKLKELEVNLAEKHKELSQIEQKLQHESKKRYTSTSSALSKLKTDKLDVNSVIMSLKKEIKRLRAEYLKKLKKLSSQK
ncbi:MAG: hypothetical protein ACFE8G_14585 [Candidatus Hermodarchaeota archaeon]